MFINDNESLGTLVVYGPPLSMKSFYLNYLSKTSSSIAYISIDYPYVTMEKIIQ